MTRQLILDPIFGNNLVLRDRSLPPWQTEVLKDSATIEIFMGFGDDPYNTARSVGTVIPGQTLILNHNPDLDHNLVFFGVGTSIDGTRDVSQLRDAIRADLTLQREDETPAIGQIGASAFQLVTIGIDNFTRFARFRKVEVAGDVGFTTKVEETIYDSVTFANKELPRFFDVTRDASLSSALTRYVRVSHSSGGAYGPTSDPLLITFANSGGTGGSSGSFDPIPRGGFDIVHNEL